MSALEKQLQRWIDAQVLDAATAARIRQFEETSGRSFRWPAILAVGFGTLMLCGGVLLFVSSHWDDISPAGRFSLVLAMVAVFHVAAGLHGTKVPMIGTALHAAGTIALGAGIFLAGQIFNLEEHWPGGFMLWALGAGIAWAVLRQWPQALLGAVLVPFWLTGEWIVLTEKYPGSYSIPAQGLLLLALLYFSASPEEGSNKPLRRALIWVGGLALIPLIVTVLFSGHDYYFWQHRAALPATLMLAGYAVAYLPTLAFAWFTRKKNAFWIFILAGWAAVLAVVSHAPDLEKNPMTYLWLAAGAIVLCYWGVRAHRKLFINYGSAGFAITVFAFYFSNVLDKLGRATGLIAMGILFLLGGWILNRLRTDLIARATEGAA
ncbi:MAG: DUF2157 domain-containing protein [Acidobacteriia bacterium]|nr:DUF2157 domain-containing protein [Terriglobia bacterium]